MTTTALPTPMTDDERTAFLEKARANIGVEGPRSAAFRDPVTQLRINLWCDAIEDQNPVYTDPDFAASTHFGGIVAPPTALQVWGMRPVRHLHTAPPVVTESAPDPMLGPFQALRDAGYFGVVATNCEQEYVRYVRPGDVLHTTSALDEVSDEKTTAIGRGFFVTNKTTYWDADDRPVGYHRFRTLHYLPGTGRTQEGDAAAIPTLTVDDLQTAERRPPTTTTLASADVSVGQELPELLIPLTPLRIVSTALASGDFEDVHHDRDAAHRKGMSDIFMNILSSNGFVGRFVTDWAGPDAELKSCAIRLGTTNYPYDTMRMSGRVTAVDGTTVTVQVRGANRFGDHVVGTVTLELPA